MRVFSILLAASLMLLSGCRSYTGNFVKKSEEQLAVMEQQNQYAHKLFLDCNFTAAEDNLRKLIQERTINFLLYQQELVSVLLLRNNHEAALEIMLNQHKNWELLLNPNYREQSENLWHGNKDVYNAPAYEKTFFYALMALSYINQSSFDDALRCVKYGLATCAAENAYSSQKIYNDIIHKSSNGSALLYYIGYLAAQYNGSKDVADAFFQKIKQAVSYSQVQAALPGESNCYDLLKNHQANVLLAIWSGNAPSFAYDKEINSKVMVLHNNPLNMFSVAVDDRQEFFFPPFSGNVDSLAQERGSMLCEKIIKYQQLKADPEKSYRFWRNLPGAFNILPLNLTPGRHKVFLSAHNRSDRIACKVYDIEVRPGNINVIHLQLLPETVDVDSFRYNHWKDEWQMAVFKASSDRLTVEVKP